MGRGPDEVSGAPFIELIREQTRYDASKPAALRVSLKISMPMHLQIDPRRSHRWDGRLDIEIDALGEQTDGMWNGRDQVGPGDDERNAHEVRGHEHHAP